ncbi:hypothetical protein DASB73_011720 [Starmerella bacillaris]|uniref:Uncharacterized protein n=1 Tax=Starmerella bacillaris TaxID=1247836 RepID=A0AAV5RF64_STABA|nr:hypothetical protein DASB73_011720 [Starmerella bacillaris]
MSNIFNQIYSTPIPAAVTSGLVFSQIKKPSANGKAPIRVKAGIFGTAFALGSYMMYDNDYKNGAGFTAVWSTLYLLAHRKSPNRGFMGTLLIGAAAINGIGYAIGFARAPESRNSGPYSGSTLDLPDHVPPSPIDASSSTSPGSTLT